MVEETLKKLETIKAKKLKVEVSKANYLPLSDALRKANYVFDVKMSSSKINFIIITNWKK